MQRITQKDLEALVSRINTAANTPHESYTRGKKGANVGCYHLNYAYGGVRLVQMANDGGGIRTISTGGYGTKRDLYHQLQAFLAGMEGK